MNLSRPSTDRHEICTQVWRETKAENPPSKVFLSTPKICAGENLSWPQIIEDHRQSEACNFETPQYINKQITDVSSTMNALQNATKLGAITSRSFDAN